MFTVDKTAENYGTGQMHAARSQMAQKGAHEQSHSEKAKAVKC